MVRSNVSKDVSDVSITVQPHAEARCTKWTLGLETAVYTAVWEQTTRDHTDFVKVIIVEYFDGFFFLSYRQKVLDLILINSLRFSYRFSLQYTGVFFLIYRYLFA